MKPNERQVLLDEFKSLQDFLNNNKEVSFLYPNVVEQIRTSYREIIYNKVDRKDNGITLYANKIEDTATFVGNVMTSMEKGRNIFTGGLDQAVLIDDLKESPIPKLFNLSDPIFQTIEFEIQNVFDNLEGTYVTQEELYKELHYVISNTYTNLDAASIKKCTNIITIKKMGIELINTYIRDYKQKYKSGDHGHFGQDFQTLADAITEFYNNNSALTQVEAASQVETWVKNITPQLQTIANDTYANAPIQNNILTNTLAKQIATVSEDGMQLYLKALSDALIKVEEGTTLAAASETFISILPTIKLPTLSEDQLKPLSASPNFILQQLTAKIDLNSVLLSAVDVNSPDFIVNQDDFRTNLTKELNEWQNELSNSLAEAADLILKLDGCTINGAQFLKGIQDCSKLEAVSKALGTLAFGEMKLRKHTDLSQFEEEWGHPWQAAINSIDVEKDIIDALAGDSTQLADLYKNLSAYVPTEEHVIAILNLSIGGKINLALEAVGRLKKEVQLISEEVEIIKSVNNLQTLGLGFNSIMNEIDLVFKEMIAAHKNYIHRVNLYCVEYSAASNLVDESVADFNKASDDIKAFRAAIFDTVVGIGTTLLCATGVGVLAAGAAKFALNLGADLAKKVGEKIVAGAVKAGVEAVGAKKIAAAGLPTVKNSNTSPFEEYLSKQLAGEVQVITTLDNILALSKEIQTANAAIQEALKESVEIDIQPHIEEYNKYVGEFETWSTKQRQLINQFKKETDGLTPTPNITRLHVEHNMYIEIIEQQLGKVDHDSWQIICDATVFRGRLITVGLIQSDQFVDHWYPDGGTGDHLKALYAKKSKPVF